MRLWSIHPKYLDAQGLVALWREALLAQAVLRGETRGYRHHPQLERFVRSTAPRRYIAEYLKAVRAEATQRGYRFNKARIGRGGSLKRLSVTSGQLVFELAHLRKKLKRRAPERLVHLRGVRTPEPHPLFRVGEGGIAQWEAGARSGKVRGD